MIKKWKLSAILAVVLIIFSTAQASNDQPSASMKDTLAVLWTSGDAMVAENVAFMYTHAAAKNKWFEKVILIVWGPSADLLANNDALQEKVKSMIKDDIHVQACIVCADSYGVSDQLRALGIEVTGMGKPLTEYLKKKYHLLTF